MELPLAAQTRMRASLDRWTQASTPRRAPRILAITSVFIAALMLLPLAYLLIRAAGAGPLVLEKLAQPRTLIVFFNTIILTITVTMLSAVIGIPLAWLTVRSNLPGRRAWTILSILPLVIPSYVAGFALVAFMGPRGMLQELLAPLGVDRLPEIYGFVGAVWALTLFTYPYLLLSVRAGLHRLDPSIEEAARSLGESSWRTFWRVTLPSLRPAIAAGALLVALYTASDFGAVSLLRFNSLTRAIYIQYQSSFDRTTAAILSLILVVLTLAILVAERRSQGRARYYRLSAGTGRMPSVVSLGNWKWLALAFCAGVVSISLIAPISVIIIWWLRGLQSGADFPPLWSAAWNSFQAASLAALAATLAALPVAYYSVRFPNRLSALSERATYIGFGLPGIVVALSLVFFGANFVPILYQTLPMLIFAYLVLFLPQALGAQRANLMQTSPRLEEAARSLGHNTAGVWRRVNLPLLRPGLWTGAALVFLTTIKELPATLLLAPTGYKTLATEIWSASSEAFFARAAAPALLLLAISALSIFILLREEVRD
ncbi:MAG: iron ABC transporter permease [Caldilineales bacterium]|nr:iron ABC transporter permease [Caldilineales bacterium]